MTFRTSHHTQAGLKYSPSTRSPVRSSPGSPSSGEVDLESGRDGDINHILMVNCGLLPYMNYTHDGCTAMLENFHDDVIKWKHFPRYWPFVRGIHRSPLNSPHKCQWRGALMFSLICAWINGWVNNLEACDLGCHRAHYDVTVMLNKSNIMKRRNVSLASDDFEYRFVIRRYKYVRTWPKRSH